MAKFSDINKGPELAAAYKKYNEWNAKTRAEKKPLYKAVAKDAAARVKINRVIAYISIFNDDNTNVVFKTTVLPETTAGNGADVANMLTGLTKTRYKSEPGAGQEEIPGDKYKFARIIASKRTTTATSDNDISRLTGNKYARHRSNNVSNKFGRINTTETFSVAVTDIRKETAFKDFNKVIGNRIGFVPEGK